MKLVSTDTLVRKQLYLWPPLFSQLPYKLIFFNIPVSNQFRLRTPFCRPWRGCPLTRASTLYVLFTQLMLLSENAFNTNQSDQLIANLVALFPWQFRLQLFYKNQELQDWVRVVTR